MNNPLLDTRSLPRFGEIMPEHVLPAIETVIAEHRAELDALLDAGNKPDIESLVGDSATIATIRAVILQLRFDPALRNGEPILGELVQSFRIGPG